MTERTWTCRDRKLETGKSPLIMGIVNATPDSFSDGGRFATADAAAAEAVRLLNAGADIVDIGGESTRPGATPVPEVEEYRRVVPAIEAVMKARPGAVVSVDTCKAGVARAAVEAGARIVNDVSALTGDAEMPAVVRDSGVGVVLMHMAGTPRTMQDAPAYGDVVAEVLEYLKRRIEFCVEFGIARECLCVDPGLGFGKTLEHNVALLRDIRAFASLGVPVLVGASRKRWIGALTGGRPVQWRLAGSLAAVAVCVERGVDVMRVHDVEESRDAAAVAWALRRPEVKAGP